MKFDKIKKLLNNKFFKGILLISSGTGLAQLINILTTPLITRLYSVDEMGVLTLFTSIIMVITAIGSFKYESAIPLVKEEDDAINILFLSLVITLSISFISLVLIFLLQNSIYRALEYENTYNFLYFIPISVFLIGIYNVFLHWSYRKSDYKNITKTRISQSFFQSAIKIGGGYLSLGVTPLLIGRIGGSSAGAITLIKSSKIINKENIRKIDIEKIKENAVRYIKFPLLNSPSQLLNVLGLQLPTMMITAYFGLESVGFYGLAYSIMTLPMFLLGKSISDVYYSESSRILKESPHKIYPLTKSLISKLSIIGLIPFIIILIIGPHLFSFIFGSEWYLAGVIAQVISPMIYVRFIVNPISKILVIFEKHEIMFLIDILRVIVVSGVFIVSRILELDFILTLIFYSIGMIIIYIVTLIFIYKNIKSTKNGGVENEFKE